MTPTRGLRVRERLPAEAWSRHRRLAVVTVDSRREAGDLTPVRSLSTLTSAWPSRREPPPSQWRALQRLHGNRVVQRMIEGRVMASRGEPGNQREGGERRVPSGAIDLMAKGFYGTTPREPDHEEEDTTVMAKSAMGGARRVAVSRIAHAGLVQPYSLRGFPSGKAARMRTALAHAMQTIGSCGRLWWVGRRMIGQALKNLRYDYVPGLGGCGWTFPGSWYVEIGRSAFSVSDCCHLSSTLAHEAAHTQLYTEGRARKLECKCFGCSC